MWKERLCKFIACRGRWGIMAPRGITDGTAGKTMKEVLPSAGLLLNYSVQQSCTLHEIAESEVQHTQTETRSKYFYPSDLKGRIIFGSRGSR
jgi:hypothetical protein